MKHRHAYHTLAWWTLTLPDCEGHYDGFLAWTCPCGDVVWATGYFSPDTRVINPEVWQTMIQREQYAQSVLRQEALRQERIHIALTDKYEAFRCDWPAVFS